MFRNWILIFLIGIINSLLLAKYFITNEGNLKFCNLKISEDFQKKEENIKITEIFQKKEENIINENKNIINMADLDVTLLNVGPLSVNCYLIGDKKSKRALVVDPGGNPEVILAKLKEKGFELESILLTHAHFDHILGINGLKKSTNAKIYLHKKDFGLWKMLPVQVKFFGQSFSSEETLLPDPDVFINDGDKLKLNGEEIISVYHTPGHSPGSVCYLFEKANKLFSGDTLFRQSVGRTDLWEGSFRDIQNSVRNKLFLLEDNIDVFPGHGPSTNIGYEKKHNYGV